MWTSWTSTSVPWSFCLTSSLVCLLPPAGTLENCGGLHIFNLPLFVCVTGRNEEEYRHQLGGYGITGELATRPVASLSGGQKSRVAFAQMTMPW